MSTVQNDGRLPILKWRNALTFSGKLGPKPLVRATLLTLAARADNTTLTFFMGVDELSHIMGIGYSTAEKHLQRALESGWVEQTSRGGSFGKVSSFRLTFGATENPEGILPPPPKRTPLPAKSEGNHRHVDGSDSVSDSVSDAGEDGNPSKVRDGTPRNRGMEPLESEGPTTPELLHTTPLIRRVTPTRGDTEREGTAEPRKDSVTYGDRETTPNGGKDKQAIRPDMTGGGEAAPLPVDWKPNPGHGAHARSLGLKPEFDVIVDQFRARMWNERRTDWDSTFGCYLKAVAGNSDDREFPNPEMIYGSLDCF